MKEIKYITTSHGYIVIFPIVIYIICVIISSPHSMIFQHKKGFTLVEMLLVIVIIGILSVTLIPRLMGIQGRARDVARETDARDLSYAIELYSYDHNGKYPDDGYGNSITGLSYLVASTTSTTNNTQPGTTAWLESRMGDSYLTSFPMDPIQSGLRSLSDGVCEESGNTYAYQSWDNGERYAITLKLEQGAGNTNNCHGVVNKRNTSYKTYGKGLINTLGYNPTYDGDPVDWCMGQMTDTQVNELNEAFGQSKTTSERCSTQILHGHNKGLTKVPSGVWNIVGLSRLRLQDNQLTSVTIPGGMSQLSEILLNNNQLTSVTILDKTSQLQVLNLHSNQLTSVTIPDGMSNLRSLYLHNNQLTSVTIPDGMSKLQKLYLQDNQLTSITIPDGMSQLQRLRLNSNQLTSVTIPDGMSQLKRLYLYKNQLTSVTIPDDMSQLTHLYLYTNQLTSVTIPSGMSQLQRLRIQNNQLTSVTIPSGMSQLQYLQLHNNQLTSVTIPDGMSQLQYLYLHSNQLNSVTIPSGMSQLQYLYLQSNQLTNTSPGVLDACNHYASLINVKTSLCQ